MKVHIITQDDPFYIPVFFRHFLDHLPGQHITLTGVDITAPLNAPSLIKLARRLHDFYGTVDFARLAIKYAAGKLRGAALAKMLQSRRIVHNFIPDLNDAGYVERLRALEPDLLVSVAASQIFKAPLLSVPKLDCLNIHSGALPEYRGMMPVFWQMHDGRQSAEIVIHTMTTHIDIGDVILRRPAPLAGVSSLHEAIIQTKKAGAQAMLDVLTQYQEGSVTRAPMNPARSGYHSFPDRTAARNFRQKGYRLL